MVRTLLHALLAAVVLLGRAEPTAVREASGAVVDTVTGKPVPDAIVTVCDHAIRIGPVSRFRVSVATDTRGARSRLPACGSQPVGRTCRARLRACGTSITVAQSWIAGT